MAGKFANDDVRVRSHEAKRSCMWFWSDEAATASMAPFGAGTDDDNNNIIVFLAQDDSDNCTSGFIEKARSYCIKRLLHI